VASEAHRVVPSLRSRAGPGYGALILEAQEPCQVQPQGYLPVGRAGLCSRDSKAGVEARQEVPEHQVGFLQGASPARRNSATSRSLRFAQGRLWKVPQSRSIRPLA